jgi:hypothetical protein
MSSSTTPKLRPQITVKWDPRRGFHRYADINEALKKATAYEIVGQRNTGKSALAETIADHYPVIIDIFGSRDNEGLCWIRSHRKDSVLFLKGASAEIDCNCAHIENAKDVSIRDLSKYKATIACSQFFGSIQEEWYSLAKLMDRLWTRGSWTEPWCVLIREAANILYSRIALGDNQYQAKNYMIYVLREMRHQGYALALDTLRTYSVDADVRNLAEYYFIKKLGIEGLTGELRFVYSYYRPKALMQLRPENFVIVSSSGPIGFGWFDEPYWHKKEHEDLLKDFDIRIKYGELPHIAESGATKVGDYEHLRIIKVRVDSGEGMEKIAEKLNRSSKTIHKHITLHNSMVQLTGECDMCKRANGEYAKRAVD